MLGLASTAPTGNPTKKLPSMPHQLQCCACLFPSTTVRVYNMLFMCSPRSPSSALTDVSSTMLIRNPETQCMTLNMFFFILNAHHLTTLSMRNSPHPLRRSLQPCGIAACALPTCRKRKHEASRSDADSLEGAEEGGIFCLHGSLEGATLPQSNQQNETSRMTHLNSTFLKLVFYSMDRVGSCSPPENPASGAISGPNSN